MKKVQILLVLILIFIVNSKKILIASAPQYSHKHPLLGIGKELSKQHEVHFFFTKKYKKASEEIKNSKFHGKDLDFAEPSIDSSLQYKQIVQKLVPILMSFYNETYNQILNVVEEVKPDLITIF
jgi:UDP:flavonoid glycosyltransferase YjiC (YdhE family)